jgi:KaiC/GvpD/RAD55 family RecA-like ATPase
MLSVSDVFGIQKLDESIGDISYGSNIMLLAPSLIAKDVIIKRFAYHGLMSDWGVIYVSTREPYEKVLGWYEANGIQISRSNFRIIDCTSRMDTLEEAENVRYVSSPADLTKMGVHIANFLHDFWVDDSIKKIKFLLDSASMLLMYSSIRTVFRFLHVFLGKIASIGGISLIVLEEGVHDAEEINILKQLMDGVLELKRDEVRFGGLEENEWYQYTVKETTIDIK